MKADPFIASFPKREWALYNTGYPVFVPHAIAPSQEFARYYGVSNDTIIFGSGKRFDWLFDKKQLDLFVKKNLSTFLKKGWRLHKEWKKKADQFARVHRALRKRDLSTLSNRELQSEMKEYYASFLAQYTPSNIIEPISYYFQHSLPTLLRQAGVSQGEVGTLVSRYARPARPSYLKRCAKDVARARTQDKARLEEKYHYVLNSYAGERKVTLPALKRLTKPEAAPHERRKPSAPNPRARSLPPRASPGNGNNPRCPQRAEPHVGEWCDPIP